MKKEDIERLKTKNHQDSIIQSICHDFNMSPIIARAHYQQMEKYFEEHLHSNLQPGQIIYTATSKEEPAGKAVRDCLKKPVVLTLHNGEDLSLLETAGLNACRRQKLARITKEAQSQGAYLTSEDLAIILTTSTSTIKRDIRALKKAEVFVPVRGRMKDIGRATSHKVKIVELFLENYQFTEIERMTRHTEKSIQRYLRDFSQVAMLTSRNLPIEEIRQVMGVSKRLVQEYQDLYQNVKEDVFKKRKLKEIIDIPTQESLPKKNCKRRKG